MWCGPRRRTEKALRCLRSSNRILSSSESGSRGLLYSSSSTSFSEASPAGPEWLVCVELGSEALFFLHLVRRFWNQTWKHNEGSCHLTPVDRSPAAYRVHLLLSVVLHEKLRKNNLCPHFCMRVSMCWYLQISIAALEFTHDMYAFLCGSFQNKTTVLGIKNKYTTRNIYQWSCRTHTKIKI